MEDIHFSTKKEFDQYLVGAQLFESQGVQGKTYKKGDHVIKMINSDCEASEESLLRYRDIYIPDIYFIRAGIYVREKLKACISEYASGHSLLETKIYGQKISILLKAISRFEEAIKRLCREEIRISDIKIGNILFSDDHFNIIDTVLYRRGSHLSSEELAQLNYHDAFWNLFYGILPPILYNFFSNNGWFSDDLLQKPEVLIEQILYYIEHIIGRPFDTLGDAERIIKEERIKLPK